MATLTIKNYRGLDQALDYPELPLNFCHRLKNIDVDDPVGKMRVRDGYSKKYSTAFANVSNGYEYYFKEADDTKFFINDNGSIKISTDGAAFGAAETLPTGATIETSFKCHFMGYKNHVLMTTGNGATNYVLGYYYVKRVNADNTSPHGTFSGLNVSNNAVFINSHWYFSFTGSKWIEKRNSDFKLVERFLAQEDSLDGEATCMCTDGTNVYIGTPNGVYKITANGWIEDAALTTPDDVIDICTDGTDVFCVTSTDELYQITISTWTVAANVAFTNSEHITCDDTASTGFIYVSTTTDVITRRGKTDITDAGSDVTNNSYAQLQTLYYDTYDTQLLVSSKTGAGHVYELNATTLVEIQDNTRAWEPTVFIDNGTAIRVISTDYGKIQDYNSNTVRFPDLFSISESTQYIGQPETPALVAGTYFYKISIVDSDDQEYTLSDHVVVIAAGSNINYMRVIANKAQINSLYRVSHFNVYRGYNSDTDGELPETDYKFSRKIGINDAGWRYLSNEQIYYFDFWDNTTEDEISDVTFFENSGIGDAVKPRYVNGKYMAWLDNQLHLANFSHDGDTYTNRIARSSVNQPDAVSFYDYYNFDVSEGDEINGITTLFGRSVVFKDRKMASFFDGIQEREFVEGLSAESGYFAKDDAVFFINAKGFYVFDGNKVYNLTHSVRTYFDGFTAFNDASVFYFDNKDRIIFSVHDTGGALPTTNQGSLVYNLKYKTWTYYDIAFKGFLKNNNNEYIGWRKTGSGGTTDYICELFDGSTKDLEDVDGGNGTAISIEYQSPLIRFSEEEGRIADLFAYWLRFLARNNSLSLKLYKFKDSGKTLVDTYSLSSPTSTEAGVPAPHYLSGEWGESYSVTIDGSTPTTPASQNAEFMFHGYTFDYVLNGTKGS
jgi:hypothetical protein